MERHRVAKNLRIGHLVDRRLDDGVSQRQILAGQALLELYQVRRPHRVALLGAGPDGVAGGEAGELDVHVVRGTPHQSHGRLRDASQTLIAPLQIRHRVRNHVADVHCLTRLRISDETLIGILVLAVEHTCERLSRPYQCRVCSHIVDTLVSHPDMTAPLTQPL